MGIQLNISAVRMDIVEREVHVAIVGLNGRAA